MPNVLLTINNLASKYIPRSLWAILLLLLLVQFAFVSYTLPISELFSQTPLFHIDNAMHWYRLKASVNIAQPINLFAYDPFFAAGSEYGITGNPAAKIPAFFAIISQSFLSEIVVWKLYVLLCSLLAVTCIPLTLWRLKQAPALILFGSVLGLVLWWVSMFRWFHTAGLVSFVLVAYLALPYMAYIVRYLSNKGNIRTLIGLGLCGALFTLIHPLFPIPIIFGTIISVIFLRQTLHLKRLMSLMLIVPVISLLPNLIWLYPFLFEKSVAAGTEITHQSLVNANLIWKEMMGLWSGDAHGSKLNPILVLLTMVAFFTHQNKQQKEILTIFTVLSATLIIYAFLGSVSHSAASLTQPNRFSSSGFLFLCIPATIGFFNLVTLISKSDAGVRMRPIAMVILAFSSIYFLIPLNELRKELSYRNIGHYGAIPPEVKPIGPYTETVLSWLAQYTNKEARILFETANGRKHDNSHIAGYLAYTSDREFIGGPYPFSYFAGYWDASLFNTKITQLSESKFLQYCELYNIGWIISFTPQSKTLYDSIASLDNIANFKDLSMYKVNQEFTFFQQGKGRIAERMHNKLRISNIEGDKLVLKYHTINRLRSDPPLKIESSHFLDAPRGFITIDSPPKEIIFYVP